jgi:hypothetical protein
MLRLIEAMCSSKSGGNLTSKSTGEPELCAYLLVPWDDPLLARLNETHPDRRYEDDPRAGRRDAADSVWDEVDLRLQRAM